ncbi:MAG: hypothetical protein V3S48_00665 [Candidatus Neomarinimicrobiota bacterium]
MKKKTILPLILILAFSACENGSDTKKETLNKLNVFVLCEGNFGQSNASLWSLDPEMEEVQGPIYKNITGNSLGDIGQSMALRDNRLWVINNNTHTIEIFLLDEEILHENSISLPGSSPRYMTFLNDKAYITCWYIPGIIVMDANSQTVIDTIYLDGMPEMIVEYDGYLYTGLIMNADWSSGTHLLKISAEGSIVNTYDVIKGPDQLLVKDDELYVTSTYYDEAYNSFTGTSRINLTNDEIITKDHGAALPGQDMLILKNRVYRVFEGGVVPVNNDLSLNLSEKIGNEAALYSAAAQGDKLFFGLTDFQAPDEVKIFDTQAVLLNSYQVGALPGAFLFYESK